MGDCSNSVDETSVCVVSSTAEYSTAFDAVLKASKFRVRLPLLGALPVFGLAVFFLLS